MLFSFHRLTSPMPLAHRMHLLDCEPAMTPMLQNFLRAFPA